MNDYSSLCLYDNVVISPLFRKLVCSNVEVLVDSLFQHLEYATVLSPGLHCFWREVNQQCCLLVHDELYFSCCFQDSLCLCLLAIWLRCIQVWFPFVFILLRVQWDSWIPQEIFFFSLNLASFQPLFFQPFSFPSSRIPITSMLWNNDYWSTHL